MPCSTKYQPRLARVSMVIVLFFLSGSRNMMSTFHNSYMHHVKKQIN
uniref:Uncharacterized protein n=1 Tax=Medicago truncatula TaxID=3880 RepID=I3T413_MEDTR|nr:unknown [Medicago truncatula]